LDIDKQFIEGGKDSSKMLTDGRINLELAVRIALEASGIVGMITLVRAKAVLYGSVR
jgi:predicted nucleic acid-binding protein